MDPFDNDRPSIFKRPFDEDDDHDTVGERPAPAQEPASPQPPSQPQAQPTPSRSIEDDPRTAALRPPLRGRPLDPPPPDDGNRRRMIALGAGGLAILVLGGFIGAALLRPSDGGAIGGQPSASASASVAPVASESAAPEPTATPDPTPSPTPAGPPMEVATGGWATVTVGELNVRREAGQDSDSVYRLVDGAVAHVSEGPVVIDGGNWYRITSLGGASGWASSGWESEPYLETVSGDPSLAECGQVRGQVFDASFAPNDPLRIGEFALPAAAFDERALGAAELLRGMGDEVCFSARLGANGRPELSTELNVNACGHATRDGNRYRLVPTDDDRMPLASQVIEETLVHPSLLDGGPADNRMSSNLQTVMAMLANEGSIGCVNAGVVQRADEVDSSRGVSAIQCSTVEQYDQYSLKLVPVSGGPTAWIKLSGSDFQPTLFQVGQRVRVNVDASADDRNRWVYPWPNGDC